MSVQCFLALSRVLLGDDGLTEAAAQALYPLLLPNPELLALLDRFAARPADVPSPVWVRHELWEHAQHRRPCEVIIMAWLFGSLPTARGDDLRWADRWFAGRFWRYVRAHPPGLSGGYFGHWAYPPEE